jgi:hypothetical protein
MSRYAELKARVLMEKAFENAELKMHDVLLKTVNEEFDTLIANDTLSDAVKEHIENDRKMWLDWIIRRHERNLEFNK